ncbi:hypothetical protein KFL_000300100 [Klebsormidium nitens]|uniref:Uncharacterized protein n=1 Tax=Klebsormidium nitens TaxID=105231 RepID=A0A0U9HK05_KLENI|nr:hypothetical protein KFL_000300100 [Klebsormidium nitens]|eukprot:GAQ79412.1 hypothetical protein KFL_000300100 [Klebsormidium nitens]
MRMSRSLLLLSVLAVLLAARVTSAQDFMNPSLGYVAVLVAAQGTSADSSDDSSMDSSLTYSFWRDVKNPNQFYAVSTSWRLSYPKHVSRKITTQCSQLVTPVHRPWEGGWVHDHSVSNRGVDKGSISSRNAAGGTAPDSEAEACFTNVLRDTYPSLEIGLLAGFLVPIGILILLCMCCYCCDR